MRILVLIASLITAGGLEAALALPINRPSKEQTVILELILKDIQDFLNSNKPVAAESRMEAAEKELIRVEMYMSSDIKKQFSDYIQQLKNTIEAQKQYQMKTYGKLLEVN